MEGISMASDVVDSGVVRSATPASDDVDDRKKVMKMIAADIDDDELFELDIALLDGRSSSTAAAADDAGAGAGQQQHALLANCLLPVRSVSKAVPVDASSALSWSSYPYSGYYSSRRLGFAGGIGRRCLLGRSGTNSARFSFSSRGFFEAYFQRY